MPPFLRGDIADGGKPLLYGIEILRKNCLLPSLRLCALLVLRCRGAHCVPVFDII